MTLLKVLKRDKNSITTLDVNPSVFRYWVDGIEVRSEAMRTRLVSPFILMLNELVLPDPDNFTIKSNWSFSNPIETTSTIGGSNLIINTYEGVKYIYRQAVTTVITSPQPATLGTYTGQTFRRFFDMSMGGWNYQQTTDLDEVTHGLDGATYQPIAFWGGTAPVEGITSSTPQGYYPVQGMEIGTHGKDGAVFRPLSFWNEIDSGSTVTEYRGTLTESITGFRFDTDKILFNMTEDGDALERYNPIDLITFAELIKLQYQYRESRTFEGNI
jgi:hypothetical protein